ncbi:MAG TPA: hypothetical protein VFE90_18655 [Myxococcales bacterium]|nr:hypothetical protein [Myxococcales bacterium]
MPLLLLLFVALACGHAPPQTTRKGAAPLPAAPIAASDAARTAAELSEETHALLRAEGELLWTRWTTGTGPLPSSALAEHPRLAKRESIEAVSTAAASARGADAPALRLLAQQLATLALSREARAGIEALEIARAQLAFAVPGETRATVGERDLDRLLMEEPGAQKRGALAAAEAKAAAPLAPLAISRDEAVEKAVAALGLGSWTALQENALRMPLPQLADLAERTLAATADVGGRAVAAASVRNLGTTSDRLRRADLPRLVRTALADAQFSPGKAWPVARDVFNHIGAAPPPRLHVDAEPSPSKGARPLALLVDPPIDVRISLRPSGGFEEQRGTFHEGSRAVGATIAAVPRWELAQLGDGSAAEGAAQLFEALAGDPEWLRGATQLRGEPLDDLVHTEATRRLLTARRAAALVLFELRRREGARTAEAQAALYRGLIQRALFCAVSEDDAARWALEADPMLRAATTLLGSVLAAQLEQKLGPSWWNAQQPTLHKIWEGGRSLTALEAARALGMAQLDPAALAALADRRLQYAAPDAPPDTPKPDYSYMQGDKKKRRKKAKKK